jgi:hypothetical protein
MNPARGTMRELLDDSHSIITTCDQAPQTCAAPRNTRPESSSAARSQAGGEDCFEAGTSAADSVPVVPVGLGGDCGEDSERAGDAVCLSFLPVVAPRFGPVRGIQEVAPRAVGQAAPRGGIDKRCRARSRRVRFDGHLRKKVEGLNAQRKEGGEDVVAPFDDFAGHDRPHHRGAQRQEVHSRVHHRADGRTQAGRVCADANFQGPRGEGGARKGGRAAAPAAGAAPAGGGAPAAKS